MLHLVILRLFNRKSHPCRWWDERIN